MQQLDKVYGNAHAEVLYDAGRQAVWCYYESGDTGCVSVSLLEAVRDVNTYLDGSGLAVRFMVEAGRSDTVYCTGGDLALFVKSIRTGDRALLTDYAYQCIELQHKRNYGEMLSSRPIGISFVRGLALGGGFESALANPFIVAERSAKFAFPGGSVQLIPRHGGFSLFALENVRH